MVKQCFAMGELAQSFLMKSCTLTHDTFSTGNCFNPAP
jgi:hypothetical protein